MPVGSSRAGLYRPEGSVIGPLRWGAAVASMLHAVAGTVVYIPVGAYCGEMLSTGFDRFGGDALRRTSAERG